MSRFHGRGMQTPKHMPLTTQADVAEAFCELVGRVNENVFHWSLSSDCFCHIADGHKTTLNFQWDREMFDFIAEAVMEAAAVEVEIRRRIRQAVKEAVEEVTETFEHEIAMSKVT